MARDPDNTIYSVRDSLHLARDVSARLIERDIQHPATLLLSGESFYWSSSSDIPLFQMSVFAIKRVKKPALLFPRLGCYT